MTESYLQANPLHLGFHIQTVKTFNLSAAPYMFEAQIDAIVYRLYGLTDAEGEIIKCGI